MLGVQGPRLVRLFMNLRNRRLLHICFGPRQISEDPRWVDQTFYRYPRAPDVNKAQLTTKINMACRQSPYTGKRKSQQI